MVKNGEMFGMVYYDINYIIVLPRLMGMVYTTYNYMVYDTLIITIVDGIYKPTYNWGAPHCINMIKNGELFWLVYSDIIVLPTWMEITICLVKVHHQATIVGFSNPLQPWGDKMSIESWLVNN